jgi:uncharacterized membrane protein YcaP (DUF421 family)
MTAPATSPVGVPEWLTAVIGHGSDILSWQMGIRSVLVFLFGLVLIRFFGRRAFGKQTPLDIVVAIMVGSNLSRTLTGNSPFLPTLAGTAVLVILFRIVDQLAASSHLVGRFVKGRPVPMVCNQELDRQAMKHWSVTEADLEEAARGSGIASLSDVKDAVLERSGRISTLRRG